MRIIDTEIEDLVLMQPTVFTDERGYFMETYNKEALRKCGIKEDFVQDNESMSARGVIRGIHFQKKPYAQGKLVRVTKGAVIDIAVDLRSGSPTFGKYVSVELTGENKRMFWIPAGFGHAFVALEDGTIFQYKCTKPYNKASEGSIKWNDPFIHINWETILRGRLMTNEFIVSEKDNAAPYLKDIKTPFKY